MNLTWSISHTVSSYWQQHRREFLLIGALFGIGAVFGILAIGTLPVSEHVQLVQYMQKFLLWQNHSSQESALFRPLVQANLKLLALVYVLGISVVGLPIIGFIVFFRGFVIGFAATLLISTWKWAGLGLMIVSMGLSDLFFIPALAIM
ncbi:MAG: stage II sporulation protein M, partial [Firmicutes bacterium]|nr:stage II sporulation protein M [Bacillota bacterium]